MGVHLQIRLKNCLQTILELEPDMAQLSLRVNFQQEIDTLKGYLSEIDQMNLSEEDVLRLERATALFLDELRLPLHRTRNGNGQHWILQ